MRSPWARRRTAEEVVVVPDPPVCSLYACYCHKPECWEKFRKLAGIRTFTESLERSRAEEADRDG